MKLNEINDLVSKGIKEIKLIKKCHDKSITISGETEEEKYYLSYIEINNLYGKNWIFEAEYKNLTNEKCFKQNNMRTVERCLLHLSDNRLYILMIELKSKIKDCKKLREKVKDKFVCTLTNLSILLSGNSNFAEFGNKELYPVGLLFFNKDDFDAQQIINKKTKEVNKNASDICKQFSKYQQESKKTNKTYAISIKPDTLETIPLPVIFYQNNHYKNNNQGDSNFFNIDFQDLIKII